MSPSRLSPARQDVRTRPRPGCLKPWSPINYIMRRQLPVSTGVVMAGRAEYEQKDERYLPCRTQAGPRAEVVGEDEPRPLAGRVLVSVRGVLQVHSAPPALCSHVEWAVAGVVGVPVSLPWVGQAAAPGMVRAELDWQGSPGTSAAITSICRRFTGPCARPIRRRTPGSRSASG